MKSETPLTDAAAFSGLVKASFAHELELKLYGCQKELHHYLLIVQNQYRDIEKLKAQLESNVKMRSDMLANDSNQDPPGYEYPMKNQP